MALPLGAAILSLGVYLLLLLGVAGEGAFLTLGICAVLPLLWRDKRPRPSEKREPVDRVTRWLVTAIVLAYGVLYLVNALAPETQPDAAYYHLGLVSEYARLGTFPDRIGFYEILPQGMEMLYLFAFAFGGYSAAKLVHFAFLIATGPVLLALGRKLGISDTVCWIAAAIYWLAPVVGISGTCAYTDAALVCAILACFYFLLEWRSQAQPRYLVVAGLLSGFCYAIKLNALLVPALAVLFVLFELRRHPRSALACSAMLASAASITIAPWMIRSLALTGNPLAPLFNTWFPNPYFPVFVERNLAKFLQTYEGFAFRNAPWELTMGGASHGILGPLFLLLPVGLYALRRSAGRWVWLAAGLLAVPWFINVGTRFLMPSLPFFALALALSLPRRTAWAALIFHAVTCWPAVLAHYERRGLWRLSEFPWQAALRLQSDRDFLQSVLWDYRVADMLNRKTRPDGKILGLTSVAKAYIDRDVIQYWQSALGVRAREELLEAWYVATYPFYDWTASWKEQALRGLRFRTLATAGYEWEIHEVSILRGDDRIRPDEHWRVSAWPGLFEAPFAFDGAQASRWRTWEPERPGMYLEVDLDTPETVSGVSLSTHWRTPQVEIFGKTLDGRWTLLTRDVKSEARQKENLRHAAIRDLKRAGIAYIVSPVEGDFGNTPLGKDLLDHATDWGIVEIGSYEMMRLFAL